MNLLIIVRLAVMKLNKIIRLSNIINEQNPALSLLGDIGKSALSTIGNELADVLGGLATGFLRAVPIPLVSAFSDMIGKTISKSFIEKIHERDRTEIKNWYYGNKLYYRELPRLPITYDVVDKVNKLLLPAFNKKGYLVQVNGKLRSPSFYLAQLFILPNRKPILDTKRNPRVFPIPVAWLENMDTEDEASFVVEYLSELWELKQ